MWTCVCISVGLWEMGRIHDKLKVVTWQWPVLGGGLAQVEEAVRWPTDGGVLQPVGLSEVKP